MIVLPDTVLGFVCFVPACLSLGSACLRSHLGRSQLVHPQSSLHSLLLSAHSVILILSNLEIAGIMADGSVHGVCTSADTGTDTDKQEHDMGRDMSLSAYLPFHYPISVLWSRPGAWRTTGRYVPEWVLGSWFRLRQVRGQVPRGCEWTLRRRGWGVEDGGRWEEGRSALTVDGENVVAFLGRFSWVCIPPASPSLIFAPSRLVFSMARFCIQKST